LTAVSTLSLKEVYRENWQGTMKRRISIFLIAVGLSACDTQEVWQRAGLTQASLDQDYAQCQLYAESMPKQYTPTQVYNATTTTYGGYATTTVRPDPYSEVGAAIGDTIANDEHQTRVRRLCMQAKGYQFAGTK
jgi:hypothetical protein